MRWKGTRPPGRDHGGASYGFTVIRLLLILTYALLVVIILERMAMGRFGPPGALFLPWLGNGMFVLVLGVVVGLDRKVRVTGVAAATAITAFILLNLACFWLALSVAAEGGVVALVLTAPVGAIGCLPAGLDLPLAGVGLIWGLSMLVPILIGVVLGAALRGSGDAGFESAPSPVEGTKPD